MTEKNKEAWPKRVFLLCWTSYVMSYLCKTNLSVALASMMDEFSWVIIGGNVILQKSPKRKSY